MKGLQRISSRLGVRGRLFALAIGIGALGAVCAVVAVSGLLSQGNKVHSVSSTFTDFRT